MIKEEKEEYKPEALAQRYGYNLEELKAEQGKLAKQLQIKDDKDFSEARIAGVYSVFSGNKIVSVAVLVDEDFEIIEQTYFQDKIRFPYIHGFRAYRELPGLTECIDKLEEKPDLIIVNAHGIAHERLGLASHLSIVTGIPTIGVADELVSGELKDGKVYLNGKIVGEEVVSRPGSRPLYVSPGNLISLNTAIQIVKKTIKFPHKFPEPLHLAMRYAKQIRGELSV